MQEQITTTIRVGAKYVGSEESMANAVLEAAAGAHTLSAAAWIAAGRPDLAATAAATVVGSYHSNSSGVLDNQVSMAYAQLATIAYERRGYG